MASALSEEQFLCVICLDSFTNPVSIPCGHNFCLECIKHFWDTRTKSYCPLCNEDFQNRPELRVNVGLKDITEHFKKYVDAVILVHVRCEIISCEVRHTFLSCVFQKSKLSSFLFTQKIPEGKTCKQTSAGKETLSKTTLEV